MKVRASEEVAALIAQVTAQADALKTKADSQDLTPEEVAQLQELVAQLEALAAEKEQAETEERYASVKQRMAQPSRPAPVFNKQQYQKKASSAEAMALYLRSFSSDADMTPEANYKARSHGFALGNPNAIIPVNYDRLNFKNRTVLSKGGSGTGGELDPQTYSDKVVEYLTYFSPILGTLGSETTSDGNLRTYFRIDDTSMESAYITESGGSEVSPTISETNLSTGSVDVGCFDITSGFQKVTFQALRDSAVNLEDKIAKANANAHARKLEREIITASGNGSTGVQGLMAVDNALSSVVTIEMDDLEDLYFSIPLQYRENAVWLADPITAKNLRKNLKDDIGRSLFDKNVIDGVEWDTLLGKRFYVSSFMTSKTILFFNPDFYMLRLVSNQIFQVLRERFAPHVAWMGLMSFGGAWLGPTGSTGAIHSLTSTGS